MAQMSLQPQPQAQRPAAQNVLTAGFNRIWGTESVDLMQQRHILPPTRLEPPKVVLPQEHLNNSNCSPDIFRSTLTRVPETASILQKSRLPFGIVIHPFKDLPSLPVIQCNTIVRCRSCRTYINPFVYFIDQRRWKCNLCYRANDLPEEFQYDPVSKTYGDPSRRPECKSSTIEFIAPSEYMVRPPQPACYLFVLDVSHAALETGYLRVFCDTLLDELERLPGDSRTQIGFITYDESVHFYDLSEGLTQPRMMVVGDVEDVFVPSPDGLLVNLASSRDLVQDLLTQLPDWFAGSHSTGSCLGVALQAAYKLVYPVGGRITAVLASLPSRGPGALVPREDPNNRAGKSSPHLGPATDFYKKLALECSSQQVAVDLFSVAGAYTDLATLSGVSQFSGGCLHFYPGVHTVHNPAQTEALERGLRRYLTRKIGFEAVMRIRCTRGLAMHTFHGNFFVRSTDLLSLPNVNPDAGFGIQVSVEEALSDTHTACFQAALLYTSSKGERRIRVHTLCLRVTPNVHEVIHGADQEAVVSLLAKMAVDRCLASSLPDAREAMVNSVLDALGAYRATLSSPGAGLDAPLPLRLLPLFTLALLKHPAFRSGLSTKLDERSYAMSQLKCLPLSQLMTSVYPDLYAVHLLSDEGAIEQDELLIPQPPRLQLSSEFVDSSGVYLLDCLDTMYILVGSRVEQRYLRAAFGFDIAAQMPLDMVELPELETDDSRRLRSFVTFLQATRSFCAVLHIFREDSKLRHQFMARLVEDRAESAFSYVEFLQHLKAKIR
ncbi:LOW QUALITY PROTEIN: protein transport protein Sec24A-like [Pollicipes pollicipes]|uniref:LOW QUALITY PROTEIN: protein transport protein Sec24A-like n=1 Tax=Pollicipes pollicipes TaxID=41117 RepID=UPI0018859EA8|nr:LOW QUALITY PROTEIN: protein transport protein Sec24A-like [Pollicipes pollicipes]